MLVSVLPPVPGVALSVVVHRWSTIFEDDGSPVPHTVVWSRFCRSVVISPRKEDTVLVPRSDFPRVEVLEVLLAVGGVLGVLSNPGRSSTRP